MTDYRYHNATGVNFGLTGQYNFNDWLGLAGGLGPAASTRTISSIRTVSRRRLPR